MTVSRIFDVLLAIVGVAMAATIFQSPNTAAVIRSFGDAFSGSLKAAQGH
ncbi:MAG TPA: hypothetical protein VFC99_05710 [Acidimicrobiia bacterium]|nr:hypothetical protein [Acidimicrobiia bacterium]